MFMLTLVELRSRAGAADEKLRRLYAAAQQHDKSVGTNRRLLSSVQIGGNNSANYDITTLGELN